MSLPHEFMRDIESAVVEKFLADSVLPTLARVIEKATVDPLRDKVIVQMPYLGVLCEGVGPNEDTSTDSTTTACRVRVQIASVGANLVATQRQVLDLIARLHYVVALQRGGDMFATETDVGEIQDVRLDAGGEIVAEQVADDELTFLVEGVFAFSVVYQLYL